MFLSRCRSPLGQHRLQQVSRRSISSGRQTLADHVRIIEVGPRDGLQNETTSIPVETKLELIHRLVKAGLTTIEAGSFVAPKWVPQMAASDQILSSILSDPPPSPSPVTYQWLLPNTKGLRTFLQTVETARPASPSNDAGTSSPPPRLESGPALNTSSYDPNAMPSAESGVDGTSHSRSPEGASLSKNGHRHEVSVFMAATESFNRANTNCSVQESLDRFKPVFSDSKEAGFAVRAYISVALGCPFEGPRVDPHKVADIAASLMEMGADEVSVADTTGMGTAPSTKKLLQTLQEAGIRSEDTAMHFHDTYGQALTNTMVALDHGIRAFDSAVGGLGGCPFAPGATGNVATEDLVYSLHSLGAKTDVHLEELSRTGDWITSRIGKQNSSRAGRATLASLRREGKA